MLTDKNRSMAWLAGKTRRYGLVIIIVAVFGIVGSYRLFVSHAGTTSTDIQAEGGTVSSTALTVGDTSASAGNAVLFGGNSPSGQALPNGNLPGWTQVFSDDFTTPTALGAGFPGTAYAAKWATYGNVKDHSGQVYYDNAKSVSVYHGLLDIYLHTEGTEHICAEMYPRILPRLTYGRFSVRYRVDPTPGYGGVWLLFPNDNIWPAHGEIDFPEGSFMGTLQAHAHYADPNGGQDNRSTGVSYGAWHTATIEWSPNLETFMLDGQTIGTSTHEVPSTPMNYSFQCGASGSTAPPDAAAGHMQVDWVTAYSYTP